MGVDLHLVIEYADLPKSDNFDIDDLNFVEFSEIDLGRNSNFFGLLAGVRGGNAPVVEARGLPRNVSDKVKAKTLFKMVKDLPDIETLTQGSYMIKETATSFEVLPEKLFNELQTRVKFTEFDKDKNLYYSPVYHTHSWLVLPELKEVYAKTLRESLFDSSDPTVGKPYASEAILKTMELLEKEDQVLTRVVFWFSG